MKPGTRALVLTNQEGIAPGPQARAMLGADLAEGDAPGTVAVSPVGLLKLLLGAPVEAVRDPAMRARVEALRRHVATLEAGESVKSCPRDRDELLAPLAAPFARVMAEGAAHGLDARQALALATKRLLAPFGHGASN